MPYAPVPERVNSHKYSIDSFWEKIVSEYLGINLFQVEELDIDDFLVIRRDAFIYRLSQSESGQEYLDRAYILEQTKPDRAALREKFVIHRKERKSGEP